MKYLEVAKHWRIWHLLKESSIVILWVHMQKLGKWRMYFTCGRIKHFPKNECIFALRKGYILTVCGDGFLLGCGWCLPVQFSSVTQLYQILCDSMDCSRFPCPSQTPGAYSNSCPSGPWCHPSISFSVVPFSSCLQSFLASGSFQTSQFFTSGSQSTGVSASASVLPMSIQDWCLQRECFGF